MFIQRQKLTLHSRVQLPKVSAANGVAHRNEHIQTGLHQHAFIDSDVGLAYFSGLVGEDSGARDATQSSRCGKSPIEP